MNKIPEGIYAPVFGFSIYKHEINQFKLPFIKCKPKYFVYGQIYTDDLCNLPMNKIIYTETGLQFIIVNKLLKPKSRWSENYYLVKFINVSENEIIKDIKIEYVIVPIDISKFTELNKEFQ